MSIKDIDKPLCKDPSTISKEIKKYHTFHPHNDLAQREPINRWIKKVCPTTNLCTGRCASCKKVNGNKVCKDFLPDTYNRLLRAPYVYNSCPSKIGCHKNKFFYRATTANRD